MKLKSARLRTNKIIDSLSYPHLQCHCNVHDSGSTVRCLSCVSGQLGMLQAADGVNSPAVDDVAITEALIGCIFPISRTTPMTACIETMHRCQAHCLDSTSIPGGLEGISLGAWKVKQDTQYHQGCTGGSSKDWMATTSKPCGGHKLDSIP